MYFSKASVTFAATQAPDPIQTQAPTPTLEQVLTVVPSKDWNRTWPADKTNMLRMTSKKVRKKVDIIGLSIVYRLNISLFDNIQIGEYKHIIQLILNKLRKIPRLDSIVELALPNCLLNINEEITKIITKSTAIQRLNIKNNYILGNIDKFANAIGNLPYLIHLNLGSITINSENVEKLTKELSKCTKLQDLDISQTYIDVIRINHITRALSNWPSLTNLNLSGNIIKNEGLNSLVEASKFLTALVFLDLSNNFIEGIEGAKCIGQLFTQCSTITSLNLHNNSLEKKGSIYLAAFLSKQAMLSKINLEKLNISSNQIGFNGAKRFIILLNYLKLTLIDLRNNINNQNEEQRLIEALDKFPTVTYFIKNEQ